ncbi:hypothetical protein NDU88_003551 [Pleurodeles waltl]|uniref:Uncharacterized protein n=1 Tax=Pleurodeles waltl TaxID=8319 RepID=A0AAV7V0B7_PLEWA|nr:hypothetical protein NDU88_003551 [Pleurodeles waltl]
MRVPLNPKEPSCAELLAAIQRSRVALEGKIETVAVEVNLLQEDFQKVFDKVNVAEGSIVELQTEVVALRKQMVQATSTVGQLEARLEDAGWASWSAQMGLPRNPLWEITLFRSSRGGVAMVGDVGQSSTGEDGENWWHHSSGFWSGELGLEVA